jgi:Lamin Tail Domain/FG-GAP-like repeat/FG-GAP repeat
VTTNDPIIATRTAHLSGGGAAFRGDFNGDGRADVLWRNVATGENYLYPLNGTTILADEGHLRTVADLTWTMAGIGDFDGDGRADILWRNTSSGQNYIYFMNGTAIAAEGFLRSVADQSWKVAGVGDFDGDGKDDILWRNGATGENYVYLMSGLQIVGEGYLRTVLEQSWKVAGVGDFDGDGKADILWRHAGHGQNYLYPMSGTTIKPSEGFLRSVADLSWHVVGVGDFDGDGHADILWRSLSTGENYLFPMDGTTIRISEGFLRTVNDQSWRVAQVGDFDGDGKADILWRNVTTGQTYLYPMDDKSIKPTEGFVRTVVDPNWLVFSDSPSNPRSVGYQLVINEVDYDSAGADTSEFIELFNPTATHVPTIGLALVLVFDGQEYARISLGSTSIPPGGYLVIGNASVLAALPAGTQSILMPNDTVHNGPAAAIALFDTMTNTLVDALAYEGTGTLANPDSNRAAVISGAPGTYNLVEGTPLRGTALDSNNFRASLMRFPNGHDTNNALLDWILTGAPTPGAANVP